MNADNLFEAGKKEAIRLTAGLIKQGYSAKGFYPYKDKAGTPLFFILRFEHPQNEKWVRPMSANGNGRMKLVLPDGMDKPGSRPPYRLPELLAAPPDAEIWIVEGEKKADLMAGMGFVATTSSNGAQSPAKTDWSAVKGRRVVIWPDQDEPGWKYAETVSGLCREAGAASVELVEVTPLGLPVGGDAVDYHAARKAEGKTEAEIRELIKNLARLPGPTTTGGKLVLFDDYDVPVINADLLPPPLAEFAAALAASTETDQGQAVMAVLGALSIATGGKFEVVINSGHREPCHVYILTAIDSGNNKSAMVSACTEPLTDWERVEKERIEPDRKRLISERKTQEKIIDKKRNLAASPKNADSRAELIAEICQMEGELAEIPALPKLFLTDATNEAMARFIADQNGRGGVFTDEGGFLVVAGGLHSNGKANIDILLKGFDGGSTRIKRADSEIDLNPHLTMCVFAQPAVLNNMAGNEAFQGRGLSERFFYYLPKSLLGSRTHTAQPMPEHIINAYKKRMGEILNIPLVLEGGIVRPCRYELAPEVRKAWIQFKRDWEPEFKPGGKLYHFAGWGNKAINSVLRIAGMFHAAKHGLSNLTIDADSARRAFELVELLIPHALAAVSFMGLDQPTADAKELLKIIREKRWRRFTRTDIIHAVRGRPLGRKERLDKAMPILEERNIIRVSVEGTATKPATLYTVDAELFQRWTI